MNDLPPRQATNGDGHGTRLTVDLHALADNWRTLAERSAPAACAAVVKADAYGIGIERAVPALADAGCRTFFVALPKEGRRARAAAPGADIYVLNGFFAEAAGLYRSAKLRPVLNTLADVEAWVELGVGEPCAIQVDTGMNRLGLGKDDALAVWRRNDLLGKAAPDLLMSHLACADTPQHPQNQAQLARFEEMQAKFPSIPASLANSAGIHLGPAFRFDLVRPGIALYGAPFAEGRPALQTVVKLEARILQIRDVPAGAAVGYGAAATVKRDSRIAILSAGYADGYLRAAGSSHSAAGAQAFFGGRILPLMGRVSMDLIAIDVTGAAEAGVGAWVELFGPNMPIGEVAEAAGTIPYEMLTGLSRRARRIYHGEKGSA